MGGTDTACIFFIGIPLTKSIDVPVTQKLRNQPEVHHPSPNCILRASRPIMETAPAGAGIPTKNSCA
ncbi:Uncharacterised protein [Mycobacterium tuberculosis]|uniref:Uncharacterized protein n=1 Tax=Mycobacterium tuberculosis TaxID=1773 RepID=A0A0T7PRS2_MYCTX|nr:Uncharacterised protein [Mycobacterium tuberculosis]COV60094.1 Uncharacterised protein [Mycobacterium tuberculosis]COW08603.1 Uncharacterised protein [Mycobacterium tuberculosis]